MAQPGNFTPILLYGSSIPTNVPLAANLTNSATGSEIAINVADKNLFFKDSGGAVNTVPIRQSSTSSNGWLSNTDWNTFNNKAPATSGTSILYGNGSGGFSNVTIGSGISFAGGTLSATGSGGTVTSVAALTIGTTGTDLSSTVANGTTTPVITLQVPTASATNRGALSAADWSTFNGKQAALVSGTTIKTVSGVSLLGSGDVGTIGVAYGGTGLTTLAAGYIPYGNGTSAFASNAAFLYDASGNVQIGSSGGGAKVNIWGATALNLYNVAGTSQATVSTGQTTTISNYFATGSVLAFGTNANGAGVLERGRFNADGVFYVGGTTSRNNELFNVKGTAVTQTFSSNGNAALNTVIDSSGAGGGICIIRGSDGFTGQSFSRVYVVSITVLGGAASTLATLIGSAGGAGTTGFTFAFAASGGFVTVTGAGFGGFGGAWNVSFVGL